MNQFMLKSFLKVLYRIDKELLGLDPLPSTGDLYKDLILSMERTLQRSDRGQMEQSGDASLTALFGGKYGVALIGQLHQRYPRLTRRLLWVVQPLAFSWLVGPIVLKSNEQFKIPKCKYLKEGGKRVCLETCKYPSEKFFHDKIGIKGFHMAPNFKNGSCLVDMNLKTPVKSKVRAPTQKPHHR